MRPQRRDDDQHYDQHPRDEGAAHHGRLFAIARTSTEKVIAVLRSALGPSAAWRRYRTASAGRHQSTGLAPDAVPSLLYEMVRKFLAAQPLSGLRVS
jgi:hypothetical protein